MYLNMEAIETDKIVVMIKNHILGVNTFWTLIHWHKRVIKITNTALDTDLLDSNLSLITTLMMLQNSKVVKVN
jgi:hypothetical protein